MMVELIECNNSFTLNVKLENWIIDHKEDYKIIDIKYSSFFNTKTNDEVWSVLILFKKKYTKKLMIHIVLLLCAE